MLLGRQEERARIDLLISQALEGKSGALVIRGDPGIGKSALLDYARRERSGMALLTARGIESEGELPFAALSDLLRPILGSLGRIPPPQRTAMEAALALGPPAPGDRFAAYAACFSLLAEGAKESPLLALVDDAHWLDRSTAEALEFCARRLGQEGVALLFAAREEEPTEFEGAGISELRLGGLDNASAAQLLREGARIEVADDLADRLVATCGGNPLALSELPTVLSDEELRGVEPLEEPVRFGPAMQRAFEHRISSLPESCQRALLLAAASDSTAVDELSRALTEEGLGIEVLEPAERARLIALSQGTVEFRHPLFRSAAYHSASGAARRSAHRAIAEALDEQLSVDRRAWHLAAQAVEPDEHVAGALERAAHLARDRGSPAAAGKALEASARLTPDKQIRCVRLREAAENLGLAGHPNDAMRLLDRALQGTDDPLIRADTQHQRARIEMLGGATQRTREILLSEAARIESQDPTRAVLMLADASVSCAQAGSARDALAVARRGFAVAASAPPPVQGIATFVLGAALILNGEAREGYPLLMRAEPLVTAPEQVASAFPATFAECCCFVEEYDKSFDVADTAVRRARSASAVTALSYPLTTLSLIQFRRGEWREAYAAATESVALAEESRQPPLIANCLFRLAYVEAGQGRESNSRAHADRALDLADQGGMVSVRSLVQAAIGLLELGLGRYEEAIERLADAGRLCIESGVEEPGVVSWAPELAEVYIRSGDVDAAEQPISELERQAHHTGRTGALAAAARCRGLMAGPDEFESHFDTAMSYHDQIPVPFERARTELCFGERLRRSGRRKDARRRIRSALLTFERLGAKPWVAKAHGELRASGERMRRGEHPSDELTPQELQVALVVAEGATNREAAAALFLSEKTIEAHLSRIYRKVSVRSRTELAGVLRDSAELERSTA